MIKMAARYAIPRTILALLVAAMMMSINNTTCEATRVLDEDEEEWMMRKEQPRRLQPQKPELLLASLQWRDVTPPGSNPGTNAATLGTKNFAAGNTNTHVHHGRRPPPASSSSAAAAYPRHTIQFGVAEDASS
ncbi:PREDICTED: uncharacterized protein LOC109161201 [Ipomoea nil]|uniref:uncharacterized protein LOC109161201 n=1 Tax=Ipomoea nil TaxID=35883 RepID=UPI000901CD05|nr:PREDICTED: uncharacterized protein LOC109161201 [Ipomoea nil]